MIPPLFINEKSRPLKKENTPSDFINGLVYFFVAVLPLQGAKSKSQERGEQERNFIRGRGANEHFYPNP